MRNRQPGSLRPGRRGGTPELHPCESRKQRRAGRPLVGSAIDGQSILRSRGPGASWSKQARCAALPRTPSMICGETPARRRVTRSSITEKLSTPSAELHTQTVRRDRSTAHEGRRACAPGDWCAGPSASRRCCRLTPSSRAAGSRGAGAGRGECRGRSRRPRCRSSCGRSCRGRPRSLGAGRSAGRRTPAR